MTNNRSDLVATSILDKNGKRTKVYRKLSSDNPATSLAFPVPSLTKQADNPQLQLFKNIIEMEGVHRNASDFLADIINEKDPTIVELMHRVVEASIDTPHKQVRVSASLERAVNELHGQYTRFLLSRKYKAFDFEGEFPSDKAIMNIKESIIAAWSLSEVVDVSDDKTTYGMLTRRLRLMDKDIEDTIKDETYWRGLSIAAVVSDYVPKLYLEREEVVNIISWASDHQDTKGILEIIKERATVNISDLQSLMEQRNGVTPTLQNGLL